MKLKKGSKEAKEYMASIRGMKKSASKKATKKAAPKKAAPKKAAKKEAQKKVGNVTLKKANYHPRDERYIIMNDGVAHLDGQPFFKEDAKRIATALRNVKKKRKTAVKKIGAAKEAAPKKAAIKKQTGTSNRDRDLLRAAKLPGRRKSPSGGFYYESRRNRSDAPGSLLGIGSVSLNQIGAELYEMEAKINMLKFRKKEARTMTEKKQLQTRINELNTQFKALRLYLNSRAKFK